MVAIKNLNVSVCADRWSQWDSNQKAGYEDEYVGHAYTYRPYPPVGFLSWWMKSDPAQAALGLDLE